MADDETKQPEDNETEKNATAVSPRRYFTRRNTVIAAGLAAVFGVLIVLFVAVTYRYGVFDSYIKAQFVAKMADIGVVFDADVFRVTINPLEVELKNATFNDRISGEKLFFIRDAHLNLAVQDLFAWQLSRDIIIEKTEIRGAEAWVNFDENGKSNFSNLQLVEDESGSAVNFKFDTVDFSMQDSVVHFGDLTRNISGDAKNVLFLLSPENRDVADEQRRYKFDLTSTDSNFVYDANTIDDIDLRVAGIADETGAEISTFDLRTPIGETTLTGTLTDWAAPKYDFDIQSSVDLTQASSILPIGTSLVGVGNFKGKVTGEGESWKIDGEIDSQSLRAGGVSLKGANVTATVAGTNSNYEADGTAIAQMLTFDDFRLDFLRLAGNVRGAGTDFRWIGELQAAAAQSKSLTLGGLFLSDAFAEYKDRQLRAEAGSGRAKKFTIGNIESDDLTVRNVKLSTADSALNLSSSNARARSFGTQEFSLQIVNTGNLQIRNRNGQTDVNINGVRSESGRVNDARLNNVSADKLRVTNLPNSTDITATNLRAGEIIQNGVRVDGVEVPTVDLKNTSAVMVVYADRLRVAKIDAGAAVLGSLNIAGVRLTIRQGRVEARSGDIDAGNVVLTNSSALPGGGNLEAVKINNPVFILEPSGRYRATADMSLGGGAVGTVALGAANAKVDINNDRIALNDLTAGIMGGQLNGNAVIALTNRSMSNVAADFTNLDLSKLLTLQGGTTTPIAGQTSGNVDLRFSGTNFRTASGTLNAEINANAGTTDSGIIPIGGRINLTAVSGLFNIDAATLKTENSELTASGRFDLNDDNSNLALTLRSDDANEVVRLIRVLDLSPAIEEQLDSMQVAVAGKLNLNGDLTGNLYDPTFDGRASLDSISLRGRELGSVSTDIFFAPDGIDLKNGKLQEQNGGSAAFTVNIRNAGEDVAVKADLTDVNAGNLLAALPLELPESLRDFNGKTSGRIDISGLPDNARGEVNLTSANGIIAGQPFDGLNVKAVFNGTSVDLEQAEIRLGTGLVTATGRYDRASAAFNFDLGGKSVPLPLVLALLPQNSSIPAITGVTDFTANATGILEQTSTYNVNFSGTAPNVRVGTNTLGQVTFKGQTSNQMLTADLTASLDGNPQVIGAAINFGDENLPFTLATNFNQSPIAPFLAFIPQAQGLSITGTGTGRIEIGGNLSQIDSTGNRVFSAANLSGTAQFSELALQIQDTPLAAVEPVMIRFNSEEINFETVRFAGGGSNATLTGVKALTANGVNNLSIDGRINLNLLNLISNDTFFSGFADTSVRLLGPNSTARLSGTANIVNGSVSTFLGSDRFTIARLAARVIFTSNQVEVEEATGFLGGGRFTASGGGNLNGLALESFRLSLDGNNVTVPLPKDFITTGDAQLEISGSRLTPASNLQLRIGGRVFARRSVYSKDIDLANLVGGRRDPVLSGGGGGLSAPVFDNLVIEGRDALVVKNNIADLTASVSLVLSGDADNPRIAGRITANSGTIFFRKDRYIVQRGVLEFPPDTGIEPIINLQAESEIAGYQVFINLAGPLKDSEQLAATVRSSPALPQADVVSLITTGNLTNSAGGIPTFAQTGINTAAEILTDTIINNPARRATDRLFGLNVFEIDPLISGQQANPGARLTVGRQINNDLRVTYATNLSQDQNQVLALEYRVSNRLSFVAQYEQRSLSNVTRDRDNFSFEVRFRKRF